MEEKRTRAPTLSNNSDKTALTQYRLYFLHGVGSHISRSHEFEAEDDEFAIRISEGWREGRRAELWAGARKIKAWEAEL